ncbi:ADP-ribosylation factor-like protein 13B [Armadillidium nasatum]|uniref:ADP-ribosylation factor-like protein 13B n=1 Tax=Armadillidium nasatum TaxID=96803 RepID=A0A5N5TI96_9CRUS|nr:ADP-ribosylation factor-like protein 13B [Armadillidium nasatum]
MCNFRLSSFSMQYANLCFVMAEIFRLSSLLQPVTLLLVGLDNAGKTTAAKGIVGEPVENIAPTIGFSPETLEYRGCEITIYDLGGGSKIRGVWPKYFSEVHGVIFVIDSSDKDRIEECHSVLEKLLSDKKITGKPVLVLANKQDVEGALDEIDIVETLKIEQIVNSYRCPARVETCSATAIQKKKPDKPIADGFRWLIDTIVVHYNTIDKRVEKDVAEERLQLQEELEKRKERIRLLQEEREQREREEEVRLTTLKNRLDSDDDAVIVRKQESNDFNKETLEEIEEVIESQTAIRDKNEAEEFLVSSSDAKELQELGFKTPNSLNSSTATSSTKRDSASTTHLIEVHPSPYNSGKTFDEEEQGRSEAKILCDDSPLRSSECVPIDSEDEIFSSEKDDVVEEQNSVSMNGSVVGGIREQIELEASLTRKPKRKNFLKRLHKTAPLEPTPLSDFPPHEEILLESNTARIP